MSEMVERVANVLLYVAREKGKQKGYVMQPISEADLEFFDRQARAAIDAMRELPKGLLRAVSASRDEFEWDVEGVWEAVIDAALATERARP